METYLSGIPTEEDVIKLLTTLQWPPEISFPIGFEKTGDKTGEESSESENETEMRNKKTLKQTSSYI